MPPKYIMSAPKENKRPETYNDFRPIFSYGAEGETRTPTPIRALDPEPSVSTNSTTSAIKRGQFIAKGKYQCNKKIGGLALGVGGWQNRTKAAVTLFRQPCRRNHHRAVGVDRYKAWSGTFWFLYVPALSNDHLDLAGVPAPGVAGSK